MASELRFADVQRRLERKGYELVRISGSHHIFRKSGKPLFVLPVHRGRVKSCYGKQINKACQED